MRRVISVARKEQRCVATTSIGVGVNLNPHHVAIKGLTYPLVFSPAFSPPVYFFMLAYAGTASNCFCRCSTGSESQEDVALCWRTGHFVPPPYFHCFPIQLFGRAKLLAFQQDENEKIAEVCTLLLGDFPENLFRAMDMDMPVPPVVVLMSYEDCRQIALKVSTHLSTSTRVISLYRCTQVECISQVLAVFGPNGTAVHDKWCCCCGRHGTCVGPTCAALSSRCNICGSSAHRAEKCPHKYKPYAKSNLIVPDGFCFKCFLPCSFTVGGISLHDSGFTGMLLQLLWRCN